MSAPNDRGNPPSAPQSTPGAVSKPATTPTAQFSTASTWSTIPGLGSAAKTLVTTPKSGSTGAPPPISARGQSFTTDLHRHGGAPANTFSVPPKTAGVAPTNWNSFLDKRSTTSTAAATAEASASKSFPQPLQGLGSAARSFSGTKAAPINTKVATVKYEQTEEYHKSSAQTVQLPHTAPLPQSGFFAPSELTTSDKDDLSSCAFTDPTSSDASIGLSEHYLTQHPGHAELKAPRWTEVNDPRSLRNALKDLSAEWHENHSGALQTLSQLNPAQYVMPFGTRVINIKTDFPDNILASISTSKYAVMQKVAERIAVIYKARGDPREKVIFLFSVNSSKKFCGMAEMAGEWDPNGSIDNWQENPESARVEGAIPVTWIYAKDVPYSSFNDIRQTHNGHPVGNMWNGMNFPSETGREVIERYVTTSSTASLLGHPRGTSYPENDGLVFGRGSDGNSDTRMNLSQRGRANSSQRGGARGGRGGPRSGFSISNWRHQSSDGGGSQFDHDPTPTAVNAAGRFTDQKTMPPNMPPTFSMEDLKNAPVAGNAPLVPGEPVTFYMGPDGRLVAVPTSSGTKVPPAKPVSSDQQGSVFGENSGQKSKFPSGNHFSNRGGMGAAGRGSRNGPAGRPPHNYPPAGYMLQPDAAYDARRRDMSHSHSPTVAMLHQAARFAAQQEAHMRNYQPGPYQNAWGHHHPQHQHLGTFGSRNHLQYPPTFPFQEAFHERHDSGDEYDELPTPTHRPPPHGSRFETYMDEYEDWTTPMYREVPGWESEVIQGMPGLQLKALFFTLAAELHILEHLLTQPGAPQPGALHRDKYRRARVDRIVELKEEVADELFYLGDTVFNHSLSGDFNRSLDHAASVASMGSGPKFGGQYGHVEPYHNQKISPLRNANGDRLPSVSETSGSTSDAFGMQRRPSLTLQTQMPQYTSQGQTHQQRVSQEQNHPHCLSQSWGQQHQSQEPMRNHQQKPSTQTAATGMGGGVRLN